MKPIPTSEMTAPEPYDYRKVEPKRDYMKCRDIGPYWNTEGILNAKVPYEKDLLNPEKNKVNIGRIMVSK